MEGLAWKADSSSLMSCSDTSPLTFLLGGRTQEGQRQGQQEVNRIRGDWAMCQRNLHLQDIAGVLPALKVSANELSGPRLTEGIIDKQGDQLSQKHRRVVSFHNTVLY